MLESTTLATPASTGPAVYRPRRPAATLLHRTVREHLETYLATAGHDEDLASNVPFYVQNAFREYLRCGEPMRIIAFILDPTVIERILTHIGESATPPVVLPARAPPQAELGFEPPDRPAAQAAWLEIDQTGGQDSWD